MVNLSPQTFDAPGLGLATSLSPGDGVRMQLPNAKRMIEVWEAFGRECKDKCGLAAQAGNHEVVQLYYYLIQTVIPDEIEFWNDKGNNDEVDDGN